MENQAGASHICNCTSCDYIEHFEAVDQSNVIAAFAVPER